MVNPENGTRSEVISGERGLIARTLRDAQDVPDNALVIIMMEHSGEEWEFSTAPLFTKQKFCEILIPETDNA